MKFCVLVSGFCILTSLGLGSDVGVDTILAPSGTIDSGVAVTPTVVVANYGTSAESLWAFMAIDDGTPSGYLDSLWLTGLAPAARETVAFPAWTPRGRDSMSATAWTACEGDTFPNDDTAKVRFLVRVIDAGLTMLVVPETLDSGVPVLPRVRVWNYGNQSLWGYLRFRVDTTYYSRSHDINLIAGGATIVSAGDSWYPLPGHRVMACSLFILPADTCIASGLETLLVRGTITHDMEMRAVGIWPDPAYVGDTVTITAVLGGGGPDTATLWVFAEVTDSMQQRVFYDSQQVHLPGPNPSWPVVFSEPGPYTVACSLYWLPDQNPTNDYRRATLLVYPRPGVEEGLKPQASSHMFAATVVRGLPAGAVTFDAMGRRSAALKSGIYFVTDNGARNAVHVRRVVIQR